MLSVRCRFLEFRAGRALVPVACNVFQCRSAYRSFTSLPTMTNLGEPRLSGPHTPIDTGALYCVSRRMTSRIGMTSWLRDLGAQHDRHSSISTPNIRHDHQRSHRQAVDL